MTDISVSNSAFQVDDRNWLLTELVGQQQPAVTDSGVLDFSLFTANTHYPNGYLNSGIVLGRVTTGGRLGPYSAGASDGRQTAAGFLYNIARVDATNLTKKVAVALLDSFCVISVSRLPANSGFDAAVRTALPLVKFRT